jgi:hypothetical protein
VNVFLARASGVEPTRHRSTGAKGVALKFTVLLSKWGSLVAKWAFVATHRAR